MLSTAVEKNKSKKLLLNLAILASHAYKLIEWKKFPGVAAMRKKTKNMVVIIFFLFSLLGGNLAGAADEASLPAALQTYAAKTGTDPKSFEPRQTAFVDLNGDGVKDALLLLQGPAWCGSGGCTMLVFQGVPGGFKFVSRSTLIRAPLLVSATKSKGWRDLVVEISGGGGSTPKRVALKFNGRNYPLNPSVQPALPKKPPLQGETVFQAES
jgi:hypothetical protein